MQQPQLGLIPEQLHGFIEQQWVALSSMFEQVTLDEKQLTELTNVVAGSDFVVEQLSKNPSILAQLLVSHDLYTAYSQQSYSSKLKQRLSTVSDDKALDRELRLFRQHEMVRLIWRDLNRLADTKQTVTELSMLADSCIDETINVLYPKLCERYGTPYAQAPESGEWVQQHLIVLGMGKLGAKELNLSSDIDLMFCYPQNGETQGAKKSIDNQEFFIRLGKQLIRALDAMTVDGFVFRVDMRLRPFGSVSPLACSFTAMESYYQQHGREWERYAMIKARVVAGNGELADQLMLTLRPFVYRKYIDYSAFESLREMKAMINSEVRRKGLKNNVKLGSGGIREIEFIAQVFQLIRGGRDSRLQLKSLLDILPLLPETVDMSQQVVNELTSAYLFLRDTEHAIQALADKQTQELPSDELNLLRVSHGLGFSSTDSFLLQLDQHRGAVSHHFAEILAAPEDNKDEAQNDSQWLSLWSGEFTLEEAAQLCEQQGFSKPLVASKLLLDVAQSKAVSMLQTITVERLKTLMPLLLDEVVKSDNNTQTLERVLKLINAILRRSAYLVLLSENASALQQLVRLCSASRWFADVLTRQPVLLDELITPQSLYSPPDKQLLNAELNQQMLRIPEDDEEQLMDSLRYFKNAHVLRVAACDVTDVLPLMKVSDYLTWLAESILDKVLDIAWRLLTVKHGVPCDSKGEEQGRDFIVVAYGKMGGIELSYGSDLDLVFLHGADSNAYTNGAKQIANSVFYTRLGQRVIHILNTFTASGLLYEIDMRLRPAGNSGLLVSTLSAFESYQNEQAWTWEHQALVRARVIAGSEHRKTDFLAIREKILTKFRSDAHVAVEVNTMREKMRDHLGSSEKQQKLVFNLKQDRGGIVDIEFIVQYFCLAYSSKYPQLIEYTDNIRIIDAIETVGLLTAQEASLLRDAYIEYRSVGHRLALQEQASTVDAEMLQDYRDEVSVIWYKLMGSVTF
jgi:glutamate-ammonia-ligase adenylyltransferase